MEFIVTFITVLALSSVLVLADKDAGKTTKIEGRGFPLRSIAAVGSCPPCPCNYGSGAASGVRAALGSGASLGSGAAVLPIASAGHSGARVHGSGAHGVGLALGLHKAGSALKVGHVVDGAGLGAAGGIGGAQRGPASVSGEGAGVVGTPVVVGPGIGSGAGYGAGASGNKNFETGSAFATKEGAGVGIRPYASTGLSGAGVHASGSGGAGFSLGAHGVGAVPKPGHGGAVVTSGAGIRPGIEGVVLPGAIRGSGLVSGGGAGGIPLIPGVGVGAGTGTGHTAEASGYSGFERGSGFANKAGGQKAGQGSFAYNVGGSDSSSYGHSSSYGDSKSFGVSASEGFNRAQGQGSHGSEFKTKAAGSQASSHSSGTKTEVVD